ncbi:acyltransferase family protein [Streptomyces longwoodensis]|uniref:acyltransferase family protein n=1 Tax=Streptomyces longwoodensis TaxID=68231 RepID=UPI003F4C4C4B
MAATLLLVHAWSPDPVVFTGGNPAAWSLSDEAWFYLTFPALDYLPLSRSLQFVLGVLAGLALKRGWRPRIGQWPAVALVVAWHLVLVPWHHAVPDAVWYGPYTASQWLSAPLYAALICAAARADLDGRRTGLTGGWMIRLGHWSFAWYLVHEIVIRAALHQWGKPAPGRETLLAWSALLAVSLTAAALAYVGVERPAERRLRGTTRRAGTWPGPRPSSGTAPSAGPAPSARPAVGAGFEGRAQGDQD